MPSCFLFEFDTRACEAMHLERQLRGFFRPSFYGAIATTRGLSVTDRRREEAEEGVDLLILLA